MDNNFKFILDYWPILPGRNELIARRMDSVPAAQTLDFADKVKSLVLRGIKVTDLSLGQPEVLPPKHIADALASSLIEYSSALSSTSGLPELRRLIAERCSLESGVATDSSNIIVTSGSKHALFVSLASLIERGDEVLVPEPYFPPYGEIVALLGGRMVTFPVFATDSGTRLDVDQLLSNIGPKVRTIILNYPNNPCGWTLDRNSLAKLVDFCTEHGIYLLSDEIYDKILFDGARHCPSWTFSPSSDYIVQIMSFSKTYAMVPYRLGYLVTNPELHKKILKAHRATITTVSPYIQKAGVAALEGPQDFVHERLATYQRRRDDAMKILKENGIITSKPEGTFYLPVKMPGGTNVEKFANDLLEEKHVAVLAGSAFGKSWSGFVRLSLTADDTSLLRAIEIFARAYKSHTN